MCTILSLSLCLEFINMISGSGGWCKICYVQCYNIGPTVFYSYSITTHKIAWNFKQYDLQIAYSHHTVMIMPRYNNYGMQRTQSMSHWLQCITLRLKVWLKQNDRFCALKLLLIMEQALYSPWPCCSYTWTYLDQHSSITVTLIAHNLVFPNWALYDMQQSWTGIKIKIKTEWALLAQTSPLHRLLLLWFGLIWNCMILWLAPFSVHCLYYCKDRPERRAIPSQGKNKRTNKLTKKTIASTPENCRPTGKMPYMLDYHSTPDMQLR